jgi:hypothetical protein
MSAVGSDAGAELVRSVEEHGGAGVRGLLDTAHRLGLTILHQRPRLRRWLFFLDPQRCGPSLYPQ